LSLHTKQKEFNEAQTSNAVGFVTEGVPVYDRRNKDVGVFGETLTTIGKKGCIVAGFIRFDDSGYIFWSGACDNTGLDFVTGGTEEFTGIGGYIQEIGLDKKERRYYFDVYACLPT
jgi:hypothetical protein